MTSFDWAIVVGAISLAIIAISLIVLIALTIYDDITEGKLK